MLAGTGTLYVIPETSITSIAYKSQLCHIKSLKVSNYLSPKGPIPQEPFGPRVRPVSSNVAAVLLALFIPVSTFTTPAATGAWATSDVADAMPAMKQPLMRGEDVAFGADGTPRGETVACGTRLPGRLRRRREHLWTASTAAHLSHVDDQRASPAAG